jgi:hypothetical protein
VVENLGSKNEAKSRFQSHIRDKLKQPLLALRKSIDAGSHEVVFIGWQLE